MKLSKKIISVLLSTSYMFTSIVFADGPEETPKTGTTKLQPVYLANVAQYMPMAEKIKLEQVNKDCAEAMEMGYANDFLYVYILLNTLAKTKGNYPILSSYSDFEVADRAFKNSIKYYRFKTETKIGDIPEELRALCDIDEHDQPEGIIFPRSYNLCSEGLKKLVKKYNGLNENDKSEKAKKNFIQNKIFDNKKFTTSGTDLETLRSHLCSGLLLKLRKLENKLHGKIDFDYTPWYINTLHRYFSVDTPQLIDSVEKLSDISPSMLNVSGEYLNTYSTDQHALQGTTFLYDLDKTNHLMTIAAYAKLALMYRCHTSKYSNTADHRESIKVTYQHIQTLYRDGICAISKCDYEKLQNCLSSYDELMEKLTNGISFIKYNRKKEYDVFKRYLKNQMGVQSSPLTDETATFLYEFFCCPFHDLFFVALHPRVTLNVGKLRETISIIDTLMDKERLDQTAFDKQDIECPPIYLRYCLKKRKKWFDKTFSEPGELWKGKRVMHRLITSFSDNTINLNALQTIVYIVYKLGCEPEIIQNMQTALLQNYVPNNAEDINKIKHIFDTAGRGKPENLDEDLGTIEYTLNDTAETIHPPIGNIAGNHTEKSRSPKNSNFGPALVGVTGLSALSALVYNGIKKYKNKPSNISKSKNNKNINKKIAKSIS